MNKKDLNNTSVLLNEVNEVHKLQQSGIDLLYNKMNWILVSDLIFFAGVIESDEKNKLVLSLLVVSVLFCVYSLKPQKFNFTAKVSKQIQNSGEQHYVMWLIEKKAEAFNANLGRIKSVHHLMWMASSFLSLALVVQLLMIFKL